MRTRGAIGLEQQLDARKMSQAELARSLGLRSGVVTRWLSGARRPDAYLRTAIERLLGVKSADWMTDDEYHVAFGRERRAA